MPDLGIGEAIAGIASLVGGVGAEAGGALAAGAEGLGGALGAGGGALGEALGGAGGALGDLFGGAAGGLGDIFGAGGAAAAGDPLAGALGGAAPAAAAGGLAPAGAGSIDLASSLGAGGGLGGDVTAFAPTAGGTSDIFGGFNPGEIGFGDNPAIAGSNVTLGGGFSPGEVGGFNPATMGFGGGTGGPGTGFGDLTSLGGGGAASPTSDLASLTGVGGGAAGPGGGAAGLPAAGGVNPAAGGGGGGGFLDSLGTGAINSITKNPLGIGLAGAGLGYSMLQGNKLTGNVQNVTNAANQEAGQGAQLQQYLQNGTLPPGMQAAVDNATKAAKARIISGYASRGQNADPAQNSALAQELAQADMNALAAAGQLQTQLLTTGLNETNMSNQLYEFLVGTDQKQAQLTGQAISNFAAAMAGGPKTIQIGGATA